MRLQLKAIVWKEIKDLSRDRKTLLTAIIMPALLLPLMGLLLIAAQKTVPVYVVIVNEDKGMNVPSMLTGSFLGVPTGNQSMNYGSIIANYIKKVLEKTSSNVHVKIVKSMKEVKRYDILVVIPKNFTSTLVAFVPENFKQAIVKVYLRTGPSGLSMGTTTIFQTIISTLNTISTKVMAPQRVQLLLACCNVTNVSPQAVLEPIKVATEYVNIYGQRVSMKELSKIMTSKLLLFSIFYVSMPVVAFISDSIAGERERKTLETLLASPISRKSLIFGKFGATIVLGILAAVADMVGLVLYIYILQNGLTVAGAQAFSLTLDPGLIAMHGFVMLLVVAATAAMIMPVASLSDNVRSAQSLGGFIQMIPLLIIFYAMYGNINALPPTLEIFVRIIPHTYAVLAIDALLKNKWIDVVIDVILMMIITFVYLLITIKIFESEYIVTGSLGKKRRG
ncbi:hypothetical protein IPA_03735 [Ignicoccus pacificus DSM 13166]|uniref:ABC-2 type transporter transmembrane domain-containing protein n=1 Tax=Ignicoccus pacificus DSM 13166 TaxID=940294 RepID=A0A977KCI1_9CREN|nr:hypothetical protein IPA_03735 [Ignicoccus pacificus DSM 13166]